VACACRPRGGRYQPLQLRAALWSADGWRTGRRANPDRRRSGASVCVQRDFLSEAAALV
jgi:hypothetical protein